MEDNRLKTLKIVVIAAVVIGLLAALAYTLYGFSLFWATFAAGITIGLLIIIILVFIVLTIYLWIRTLLFKREIKRYENRLEQAKMELIRCRSKLNRKNITESDSDD
jgi:uncharacterized membrane protein